MSRKLPRYKGTRYSDQEKAEVLSYVEKVNSERGRGGITAAARKFDITPLTVSNWVQKEGRLPLPSRGGGGKDVATTLRRLADVHERLTEKEAEITELRRDYATLKARI